jgi:tryptophanyl-tRNA synthetase
MITKKSFLLYNVKKILGLIMRVLTGVQPSGDLHIGNYFGSIKKMVEAQEENDTFIFIANYHAQTSLKDGNRLSQLTMQAAIDFLALGVNPEKSTFWVQSDVKEVLELYWILSSFTPMGLLERAHSYKDKVAKGIAPNHSLFSYPVLMAADILLYSSEVIPVGKDQIQHVEITRDIAIKFNNEYGDIFTLPNYKVDENVATVPGIDGQKMSKSYGNTINIFAEEKKQLKVIKKIVTQNVALEEPKEWRDCNVYNIAKLFLDEQGQKELQARYERGGEGHGHFKLYLGEVMWNYFSEFREKRDHYLQNQDEVREILKSGADKASAIAQPMMEKIRTATGVKY